MLGFIKQEFVIAMTFFSFNILNVNPLECISMSNEECKARTKILDANSNEPVFYPYSIKVNKFSGSCNNINDPYAKFMFLTSIQSNVKNK